MGGTLHQMTYANATRMTINVRSSSASDFWVRLCVSAETYHWDHTVLTIIINKSIQKPIQAVTVTVNI
eukprot:6484515-Amphidinium_carterae.1